MRREELIARSVETRRRFRLPLALALRMMARRWRDGVRRRHRPR